MNFIASIVFIIVQIIFIPLGLAGLFIVFYKQVYGSKKLGVSSSAIEIINGRWTMDVFGLRKDTATVLLNHQLPNNSLFGQWLILFPRYLRYKISGINHGYPCFTKPGEEGIVNLVISRTTLFDNIINKAKGDAEQFVVIGAGYDTRCYGDLKTAGLELFELDQANTQQLKVECLKKAGIDTSHVNYVEVDFTSDHWWDELEKAGYDPGKKTILLWEGVTIYLSENDVRKTIRAIKGHAASGSTLAVEFGAKTVVTGEYSPIMKASIKALKITDEGFIFGLDYSSDYKQTLIAFLESEGLKVADTNFLGYNTSKGPYLGVAEIAL